MSALACTFGATPEPTASTFASVDGQIFRQAMRSLASGVTVITAGAGEDRSGLTATSATSFSADPPSVLISVNRDASAAPIIVRERRFGFNVLAAGQAAVAERFSGKGGLKSASRYDGSKWRTLTTGVWLLEGASAALDCVVDDIVERHSHMLIIGRVVAALAPGGGGALIYRNGEYWPVEESRRTLGLRRLFGLF
jgi:flavin reductase (DIM6/NTAB) family NADH-FMN oxidoreductase RutF